MLSTLRAVKLSGWDEVLEPTVGLGWAGPGGGELWQPPLHGAGLGVVPWVRGLGSTEGFGERSQTVRLRVCSAGDELIDFSVSSGRAAVPSIHGNGVGGEGGLDPGRAGPSTPSSSAVPAAEQSMAVLLLVGGTEWGWHSSAVLLPWTPAPHCPVLGDRGPAALRCSG